MGALAPAQARQDIADRASAKPRKSGKKRRASTVLARSTRQGWRTTDAEEIEIRRWRGRSEIVALESLEPAHPFFGSFRVVSGNSGSAYEVEIRGLDGFDNSCGCIDHRVNALGTCKHIEGVLAALRRGRASAFRAAARGGSPRVEVFLRRQGAPAAVVVWPHRENAGVAAVRRWLTPFLVKDDRLGAGPAKVAALIDALSSAPAVVRRSLRVSRHFAPWLERLRRLRARETDRASFLAEAEAGRASLDLLRHPLLPYQREGMLHLAFGERALLADEMGLGKTVQAIAACELLAQRNAVARVLVVCPASLKAEWEEQIARFADRPTRAIFGNRSQRLTAYREPCFFNIVNYEQVLGDADDINALLKPHVVVLDEAQRIKNWRTKTARRVKALRSRYAFVLTGTPVENRIDELYSIVQYLDPEILGPLFRFNRDFYKLDELGRPVDYQNMAELRRHVQTVMLRRRKSDVEAQLPGRTVKTYFVGMMEEQRKRYLDYEERVSRLAAQARRRPLTEAEFEMLQKWLACMRMICDTPAILDPACRISPKLEELERILEDLLAERDRKIIVFSEWERMLEMVRELAVEMGVEAAWHTGSVPQLRRRAEINRFKQDPSCRLFLSTDSGSLGLNLQVASAVVNIDLPWNPARLEQRIARAWRKNQQRSVTVVNLVCEGSIEHRILYLLESKQSLADGVLDGRGDLDALKMPSGRGAFIERLAEILGLQGGEPPRIVSAEEALAEELSRRHGERALLIETRPGSDGREGVLAVLDLDPETLAAERRRLAERRHAPGIAVELLDRATWLAMERLAASGMLRFAETPRRVLHRAAELAPAEDGAGGAEERAADLRRAAERALRMAMVLSAGGFPEEAPPMLARALFHGAAARLSELGELPAEATLATSEQMQRLVARGALPGEAMTILQMLPRTGGSADVDDLARLAASTSRILAAIGASGEVRGR
jgi:hypothetical protein